MGDWSKLTSYLNNITSIGEGQKPKLLMLTQDHLRAITGSTQQADLYKNHTYQTDIVDRAQAAGYKVEKVGEDFIFWSL